MSRHALSPAAEQAIAWMVRLRSGRDDARQQALFQQWLGHDPANAHAWEQLQRGLGGHFEVVRRAPGTLRDTLLEPEAGRRDVLRALAGLSLLGGSLWFAVRSDTGQALTADIRTGTGERRSVQLPDGTRVQLNTDSAVDLDFNAQQRMITLLRGEILVTCGAASSAPLLVQTRHGLFEGIDGRFAVHQANDCTRLSVVSGNVAIHSPHQANGLSTQVHAGESYLVRQTGALLAPPLDMDIGAWADGLIVTRDMRLADFVAEVGRYRHGYLGCSADIAELRLSGVFRLEDTDKLLAILPQTLPVQLRYRSRWWVNLERSA